MFAVLSYKREVHLIASVLKAGICEVNSALECFKVLETSSSKWLTLSHCVLLFFDKACGSIGANIGRLVQEEGFNSFMLVMHTCIFKSGTFLDYGLLCSLYVLIININLCRLAAVLASYLYMS